MLNSSLICVLIPEPVKEKEKPKDHTLDMIFKGAIVMNTIVPLLKFQAGADVWACSNFIDLASTIVLIEEKNQIIYDMLTYDFEFWVYFLGLIRNGTDYLLKKTDSDIPSNSLY